MRNDTDNTNILDFQDPGSLSEELLSVPGFVNGLKGHTLATTARPNEPLAFAGALAMLAHLTGRGYRDERGGRTNLYLAALAPSGMGKDAPRTVNKLLAAAAGIAVSVPDSVASGEGLEEAVAANPSLLLQCDEADQLLTAMRDGDGRTSRLNEMLLRFFSESASNHVMRLKASDGGRPRVIPFPHLTLFATGIPKFFYSALNARALENGLLGRCLFIDAEGFRPLGRMRAAELPTAVVDAATAMAARERLIAETGVFDPVTVGETPDARLRIADMTSTCDAVTQRLMDSDLGTAASMYARVPEKALKLAMLWAISADPENPQITAEAVDWGARFVNHVTRRMLYMSQFYVAEGSFDRLKKRFLRLLARHGGRLDHSTLLRNLPVDAALFKKMVETLKMCEQIEDEQQTDGKRVYLLRTAA